MLLWSGRTRWHPPKRRIAHGPPKVSISSRKNANSFPRHDKAHNFSDKAPIFSYNGPRSRPYSGREFQRYGRSAFVGRGLMQERKQNGCSASSLIFLALYGHDVLSVTQLEEFEEGHVLVEALNEVLVITALLNGPTRFGNGNEAGEG